MKTPLSACLALLATLALGLLPGPARAQTLYDCTNGCYVVTCTGSVCTIWRCDPQGCRKLVTDPRMQPQRASGGPDRTKPVAEVAYAKICPSGERCRVFELTAHDALLLGSFDNIDDLVDYRRSLRASPGPERGTDVAWP